MKWLRKMQSLKGVMPEDIRFADPQMEASFMQQAERSLMLSSGVVSMSLVAGYFSWILTFLSEEDDSDVPLELFSAFNDDPRRFVFWVYTLGIFVAPTIVSICVGFRLAFKRCSFLNVEYLMVAIITIPCLILPWANQWSAALLYGQDPNEVWATLPPAECIVVLAIEVLTTTICHHVPIRMVLKWIPPVCGFISFTVSMFYVGPQFPELRSTYMFLLSCSTISALTGAKRNERIARQEFLAQGQVSTKQNQLERQHKSVSRILDRLCDGLVQLGHDFTILEPSARLGALLLHKDWRRMEGSCFCDYIGSAEESESFVKAVRANTHCEGSDGEACESETDIHGMVHLHLRDSSNRTFLVYAYHSSYSCQDGEWQHVVGIVEAQERPPPMNEIQIPDRFNSVPLKPPSGPRSDRSKHSLASSEANRQLKGSVWHVDSSTLEIEDVASLGTGFGSLNGKVFTQLFRDPDKMSTWIADRVAGLREERLEAPYYEEIESIELVLQELAGVGTRKYVYEVQFQAIFEERDDELNEVCSDDAHESAVGNSFAITFQVTKVVSRRLHRYDKSGTSAVVPRQSLTSLARASGQNDRPLLCL
eukprot:TRINITY_DN5652_c0_g1_i2.p1 TRINITY_DN5652_c0_g1~~TRINITY_DN5652_c0_g1_i2.p1  ORF type:complete len:628 (-),score=60.37 TRINITY_DN5652_c0_g1_i2:173-1951(-)